MHQEQLLLLQEPGFLFAGSGGGSCLLLSTPPASWCQATFASLPVVTQMFLAVGRGADSGAAPQTRRELPNGEAVAAYVSAELRRQPWVSIAEAVPSPALLQPLLAGCPCASDGPADYSETWMK